MIIQLTFHKRLRTPSFKEVLFWNHVTSFKGVYSITSSPDPITVTLHLNHDDSLISHRIGCILKFAEDLEMDYIEMESVK